MGEGALYIPSPEPPPSPVTVLHEWTATLSETCHNSHVEIRDGLPGAVFTTVLDGVRERKRAS